MDSAEPSCWRKVLVADAKKLRVGVIGAGGIARSVHLPSLNDIELAEVVAVCDLVEERAIEQAERFNIPKTYSLYKKMLAEEDLDAVFVLVEPSNAFHPVMYAIKVGFNRRHIPVVQKIVKTIRECTTITQVEGRFMKHTSAAFDQGGHSAFCSDVIHAIDLIRSIANGTPLAAATIEDQIDDVVPNMWNAVVRFDNHVTGVIKSNYNTGGRFHTFEVHGPGASAFINLGFAAANCEADLIIDQAQTGYSLSAGGGMKGKLQHIDGKELAGSTDFYRFYGFYQEDLHFLECVRDGKQPMTDINDAVKTFELVDLLLDSRI